MSIEKNVAFLEKALEKFSPVTIDYGKDKVVGFPNDINNNDLIIYVKKDETPESLQQRVMRQAEWQILPRATEIVAKQLKNSAK